MADEDDFDSVEGDAEDFGEFKDWINERDDPWDSDCGSEAADTIGDMPPSKFCEVQAASILLFVDMSSSMKTPDVIADKMPLRRIDALRQALQQLINQQQSSGAVS
ncbi:unnamed protein product, partial [Effrenium voratum]